MRAAVFVMVLVLAAGSMWAEDLEREIAAQDAAMFAAFNAQQLEPAMVFFSDDVEFYHDKDGRLTHGQIREAFQRLFSRNLGLRRELVAGSLRVYPIPGYGALEVGQHQFCHVENGKNDCGVFAFTMIWQKKGDRWQVTRAMSYGH